MGWGEGRALSCLQLPLQHGSAGNGAWLSSFTPALRVDLGHTPPLGWTHSVLQTAKSQLTLGPFAPRAACDSAPSLLFFLRLLSRVWVRAPFSLPVWSCPREARSVRGGVCLQGHGHVKNSDNIREH